MELITKINAQLNGFVWGIPAIVCIIGVGLYLSINTRFIQIRKFGLAMKSTLGKIFSREDIAEGAMSPFQAVCTALAATVGTGNIAGVAGAIALGGPGAVFWMWISAFLGMCTKFSEVTLAVKFRERNANGEYVGGPMYYIEKGLGKKFHWLSVLYAFFGVLAVFGTGSATQVNTIVTAVNEPMVSYGILNENNLSISNFIIGVIVAILVALVLLGGVKRLGSVTEKLIPFMAVLYIVLALGVIIVHIDRIPVVFISIFKGAFTPSAITGGVVGSMLISMRKGVSRGIFSNEAGIGTGSIAHACADTDEPVRQGLFGIFEVFVDTIIICTLTALVILCSGLVFEYGVEAGAELTISSFVSTYGNWVAIFTAVAMCCFAFSTTLGWGLYGSRCIEFLFSEKLVKPFLFVYSLVAILGATVDLGLIWSVADTFNGFMAIPNLIGLFLLAGVVAKLSKEYFGKFAKK